MTEEASERPDQLDRETEEELTLANAGCWVLMCSPLLLLLGTMRSNITRQLDADLAMIIAWFCDTAITFIVLFPFGIAARKNKFVRRIAEAATVKLYVTVCVFYGIAIIAFIVAAVVSIHYCLEQLFSVLFG